MGLAVATTVDLYTSQYQARSGARWAARMLPVCSTCCYKVQGVQLFKSQASASRRNCFAKVVYLPYGLIVYLDPQSFRVELE